MTWNMGSSEDKNLLADLDRVFSERLHGAFNDVSSRVDMVLVTGQECKRNLKL